MPKSVPSIARSGTASIGATTASAFSDPLSKPSEIQIDPVALLRAAGLWGMLHRVQRRHARHMKTPLLAVVDPVTRCVLRYDDFIARSSVWLWGNAVLA